MTTPHMPRVDWQMWFAALGDVRRNRWFLVLCWRLLDGSPEVKKFFVNDPFGSVPPRYLRANAAEFVLKAVDLHISGSVVHFSFRFRSRKYSLTAPR